MPKNRIRKYYVLVLYKNSTPEVEASFDAHKDAITYASLASKSDKDHVYIVTQTISTALDAMVVEQ